MDIEVSQEQGRRPVTVFHIKGEINITTYEQLEQKAREAFNAGTRDLLLDLTEVTFVDSTGLGALIGTRRRVHAFHGSLGLVIPNEAVMKVFTITGLEKVFDIYDTLDAALAA